MNSEAPSESPQPKRTTWIVWLVIALGFTAQFVRIMQVQSTTGEVPFHSANDRSRWCTIAALAVNGSYEIDEVLAIRDPETRRRTWYSIDLVRHRGPDGKQHFYSSKPPLLPTIYTGAYLAARRVTGISLIRDTFTAARLMLVLVNLIPLAAFWLLILHWTRRQNLSSWATTMLMSFLVWGCYLSTFANTLNNHLPAAIAVGLSLYCISRIIEHQDDRRRWFIVCGLCTAFGAANELPALSWVAAAGGILLIANWRRTLTCYAPALLPVCVAFFAANYAAHGELSPAYAHRNIGGPIATLQLANAPELSALKLSDCLNQLRGSGIELSAGALIKPARRAGVAELWDPSSQMRYGLTRPDDHTLRVHQWGDWYDYPSSYWIAGRKQGVDKGERNRGKYIAHCLIGHHGIFSLTPFWLVSLLGAFVLVQNRQSWNFLRDHRFLMLLAVLATSIVSIGFYLARPLEDCNYGGVTSGFRWGFWLAPLWLWLAMHGLKKIHSNWGRAVVAVLVAASVFSAIFPWSNPWTSPWIMQWMQWSGWETWV